MREGENKVAPYQFFFLIIQSMIGVSLLSLPYTVFQVAKDDGWISMLLAGVITQILLLIMWLLARRFESSTIFEISRKIFGKWIGTVFLIGYLCYFIATASVILLLFSRVLNVWVLPRTPTWATMFLMTLGGMQISRSNLRVFGRFYTFVSILILVLLIFLSYTYKDANFLYLLPVGQSGWKDILTGSKGATLSMLGFESFMVLYPFVKGSPSKKLKIACFANLFVTLFYTVIIVSCFLYFSPAEMALVPEPVLYMLKSFSFSIISRIDLLFLSIWVVTVTTSFMTYFYMVGNGLAHLFNKRNHNGVDLIGAVVIFIVALIPGQNETTIDTIDKAFQQFSIVFVAALPLLFLLCSYLFRKKDKEVPTT